MLNYGVFLLLLLTSILFLNFMVYISLCYKISEIITCQATIKCVLLKCLIQTEEKRIFEVEKFD